MIFNIVDALSYVDLHTILKFPRRLDESFYMVCTLFSFTFQGYLASADNNQAFNGGKNNYHSDESITRSMSDMSMSSGNHHSNPGTPNLHHTS